MLRRRREIPVCRQKGEFVSNAKLCNQGIYCPDLHSCAPAAIAKTGGINVILSIRNQHWQCGKLLHQLLVRFWASKTLQQFLQNESGGDDGITSVKRRAQGVNLRSSQIGVAPKCERPHAGIDKKGHRRERSIL